MSRDTSGHGHCSYVQSTGGPSQLGQLHIMASSLITGDGLFIISGHENLGHLIQEAASPEYSPYRSYIAV